MDPEECKYKRNRTATSTVSDNYITGAKSMAVLCPPPGLKLLVISLAVCLVNAVVYATDESAPVYSVEVVNEFPHDSKAFTEGLLYVENDTLFESTGLYGQSSVRRVDLTTGKVELLQNMDKSFFGEGLTLMDDKRLYQVTWKKNIGFVYDSQNLSKFEEFTHDMPDGWGLTTDGKVLFGSDGSSTLYQIDPHTYKVTDKRVISFKGHQVFNLNELEYINGEVWANIFMSDCIARISYADGNVVGWILLQDLREKLIAAGHNVDVLNGIAWDGARNRLFVTGKLWPKLFEIKLHPVKKMPSDRSIQQLCFRKFGFY